ncbi:MAG: VanW family protein [Patescibacteria group bacterium]
MLGDFFTKFKKEIKKKWKITAFILVGFLFLVILIAGGDWGYLKIYENKVYPGVYAGQYHLGGMTAAEVKGLVENFNNRLWREGIDLLAVDSRGEIKKIEIDPFISSESVTPPVILDSDDLAARALLTGRSGSWWERQIAPWEMRLLSPRRLPVKTIVDKNSFFERLDDHLLPLSDQPHDAAIKITQFNPLSYQIVPERPGWVYNNEQVLEKITDNLSALSFELIKLTPQEFKPRITADDLSKLAGNLEAVLSYGDLSLNYIDPQTQVRRDWTVKREQYGAWLAGERDENGNLLLGLKKNEVLEYLNSLRPLVDQPPQDAKFVMAGDKVQEFQASRPGLTLDAVKTFEELNRVFLERNYRPAEVIQTVGLVVKITESQVKVTAINNLGISEILGVGITTFKDSHTNRIKNIANAVKRLNGTLIKPGEAFSAIKYAGSFTAENGFLPEDVIKGDRILKEIGGGMCQIGTTLFRMAMNAGMPITERRNHSLVVGYYADPVNGNPGTDATLYEPLVDFKFLNDTGNYLLLQAEIDYKKQQLTFTLWGKSDGRKGWYTHPTVSRWIPAGEPKDIEVDNLKPGEKKCQNAFRGAVASFTYTRVTPSGEKIDRVFDSYYRSLPKICLVGKTAATGPPTSTPAGTEPLPLELN